jgi:outer membrane biosynthesis protein TonB
VAQKPVEETPEVTQKPVEETPEVAQKPVEETPDVAQKPVEETPQEPSKQPDLTIGETSPRPPMIVAIPKEPETPVIENRNTPPVTNFSARTINSLDRGKYYVQVAAQPENLVENMLNQIDRSFAPVVLKGTDNLYRILIGPLNQGESAAVLARVKSIGYKDAFVRRGG